MLNEPTTKEEIRNAANVGRQLEQKVFDKLWKNLNTMICKAGFIDVEHGDKFIKVSDTHGDYEIDIKVEVRKIIH